MVHPVSPRRSRRLQLSLSTALAGVGILALSGPALATGALPTGGSVTAGTATIANGSRSVTVTQTSQNAVINWQSFSVGQGESITFDQPNAQSATLNRVTGGTTSTIAGQITSNGAVYLVNPNGIAITSTGVVDTGGGFVASTLSIGDADFMAGKLNFVGDGASRTVSNGGNIRAGQGAYVALLGGAVANAGTITVPLGRVGLGSGEQVALDLNGGGFMQIGVPTALVTGSRALVDNSGAIVVSGGSVTLSAAVVKNAVRNVINVSGTISADSAIGDGGTITLIGGADKTQMAGTVTVSGTLSARATGAMGNGGSIETSGATVDFAGATVTTASAHGKSGTWLIDPTDLTIGTTADQTTLQNALASGNVTLTTTAGSSPNESGVTGIGETGSGNGDITINQPLSWGGTNTLTLQAYNAVNLNSAITAANGGLMLTAGGTISAPGAIQIGTFTLTSGAWTQNTASLPAFSATNFIFDPAHASFLRTSGGTGAVGSPYQITDIYGLQGIASGALLADNFVLANTIDASGTSGWSGGSGFVPIGTDGNANIWNGSAFVLIGSIHAVQGDGPGGFSGTFNGAGYAINGLTINRTVSDVGLFGVTSTGSLVENVGLVGGSVTSTYTGTGDYGIGGLVGYNQGTVSNSYAALPVNGNYVTGGLIGASYGAVSDSYATGNVTGNASSSYLGGLVGYQNGANYAGGTATISQSYATGAVSGFTRIGGLVGEDDGQISLSYAKGAVTSNGPTNNTGANVGGLVGYLSGDVSGSISQSYTTGAVSGAGENYGGLVGYQDGNTTITQSFATGSVTGTGGSARYYGGLVGSAGGASGNGGSITQSYATGAVNAWAGVGGLVGLTSGSISQSYATGMVTANAPNNPGFGQYALVGGLIGYNQGTVAGSYWDTQTSGTTTGIGIGTFSNQSTGASGLTTAQFQAALPTGFNATAGGLPVAWGTASGLFPYLLWQGSPVAISGYVYSDAGVTPYSGATVTLLSGGTTLAATTSAGANGYYYTLLAPGLATNGQNVLAYTTTIGTASALSMGTVASDAITNLNLWAHYQLATTADTTWSALTHDFSVAAGSNATASTLLGTLPNEQITATGAFTVDTAINQGGNLTLLTASNITIGANVTLSTGALTLTPGGGAANTGGVTATGAISVATFDLTNGNWVQNAAVLPAFSATNFTFDTVNASFLRVTGGTGTTASPYQIADLYGLQGAASQSLRGESFILTANIDASETAGWNGGAGFQTIGTAVFNGGAEPYYGTFNGAGYAISGLTINQPTGHYIGMFGDLSGTVENLTLTGAQVSGAGQVGGIAGLDSAATITNVAFGGAVAGTATGYGDSSIGGLVGFDQSGNITGSSASGSVTAVGGVNQIGGLVGYINDATIRSSHTSNTIQANGYRIGGLVGYLDSTGSLVDVYATGAVNGGSAGSEVGGLVGYLNNGGQISVAYASGAVTGYSQVGGLVGDQAGGGSVTDAYATGAVTGDNQIGGLEGASSDGIVTRTFATGLVTGTTSAGGLIGADSVSVIRDSAWDTQATGQSAGYGAGSTVGSTTGAPCFGSCFGATGLTTAQMQDLGSASTNYAGFNFTTTWSPPTQAGQGGQTTGYYPQLYALTPIVVGTLANVSRNYGSANPVFGTQTAGGTAAYQFGPSGDTLGPVNFGSTTAVTNSNVGMYAINPAGGTAISADGVVYRVISLGSGMLTIDPVTLTVVTANLTGTTSKTYDGTTVATLDPANFVLSGFVGTDGATVTQTVGTYASANVGAGILVTASLVPADFIATGTTNLNNYTLPTSASGAIGTITPLALTGSIASGSSVYGQSLAPGTVTFTNLPNGIAAPSAVVVVNTSGHLSSSGNLSAGSYTGIETISSLSSDTAGDFTFAGVSGNYAVSQASVTASIGGGSSVYGTALAPGAVSLSGLVAGDQVTPASVVINTSGHTSSSGNLNAGTYSTAQTLANGTLSGVDSGNYVLTNPGVTGTYSVSPLALTGTLTAGSSVYGSTLSSGTATFTNVIAGDSVAAGAVTINTAGNLSSSGNLNAGSYTGIESVSGLTGADAGNYSLTGLTGNYTVSKLALTGTLTAGSSVYGAALKPGTATFTNVIAGDNVAAGAVTINTAGNLSSSGNLNAGSYTGIESVSGLTGADAGNYSLTGLTGNYFVSKLALTGTLSAGSSVYGAALNAGTVAFTNVIAGDNVAAGAVTVNTAGNLSSSGNLNAGSYSGIEGASGLTGADAGNYSFAGLNGNYLVSKTALTGTLTAGSSVYGAALDPGTATFTNVIAGDSVAAGAVTINSAGNLSSSGNLNAGSYTGIESVSGLTGADAGNYSVSGLTGNYTVSKLALTGTLTAGSSVYGSALNPGAVTFTNAIAGDSVAAGAVTINTAGNLSSSGNLNAGSYTGIESATSVTGADAGNYSFAGLTGNYTVSKLVLTGTLSAGSSVYGSALNPGAVTFTNAIAGDNVAAGAVTINTAGNLSASGNLNAGNYTGIESASGLTGADAGNYSFAGLTGAYTVTPAALTVTYTANLANSTYGQTPSGLSGTTSIAGLVEGDTLGGSATFTTAASAASQVGSYGITGGGITGGNNYQVTSVQSSGNATALTVNPASLTVTYTATPTTRTAGSTPTGLTGTTSVTGLVNGDTLSGTASFTTPATSSSPAGAYAIDGTGLSASDNYILTAVQSPGNATALTLIKPPDTAQSLANFVEWVLTTYRPYSSLLPCRPLKVSRTYRANGQVVLTRVEGGGDCPVP